MPPKIVYRNKWFSVEEEYFNGLKHLQGKPYYRINGSDSVFIIPITPEGKLILVQQYRPAINTTTIEFPAGAIENNELPYQAAKRELEEETGHCSSGMVKLGKGRVMMDRFNTVLHGFVALNAEPVFPNRPLDLHEGIKLIEISWSELKEIVQTGKFEQLAGLGMLLMAEWEGLIPKK